MEIRLLNPADAKNYWELRLEALKGNPEAFLTSYEEALQRENPVEQTARNFQAEGQFTFGAFENKELVGVVTLIREKAEKQRHVANIVAMYVSPKLQGKGIGKALLIAAINQAKNMPEIEKLNLTVNASNEKAKRLYTKLGFKVYGLEEKSLKIDGVYFDEEHMALHIK